jgi:aryl-alcohol dehydrogenase-like predicted oxidoreductase
MEYTRVGSSGLKISRIALGTMGFGDGKVPFSSRALPALPCDDAKTHFDQARDLGITF